MKSDNGADFDLNDVFLAETVTGKIGSAAYPDAFRGAAANAICFSSGAYGLGGDAGIFFMRLDLSADYVPTATGTRIAKI